MKSLAIVSPQRAAYSETFIHTHKSIANFRVNFYHGGDFPTALDGEPLIDNRPFSDRVNYFFSEKLGLNSGNINEHLLTKSFQNNKIHCVLAEYGTTGAAILPICKKLNIPLVVHFHGFDATHHGFLEKLRGAYTEMFDYAHAVIAVSNKMAEDLKRLGCPAQKIHYNVYGPDPSFAEIIPTHSETTLVSLGRFVDKKAPYYTILAFHEALRTHPNAKLIFGGDGYLLNSSKNLVKYLNLEESVSFPGILSRAEYENLLRTARAYAQHSITAESGDSEGTPVSILEASAAGLPVISTIHAGIPDVIIHGETGLLSPEHDVAAMAAHFAQLLGDPTRAAALGAKGKSRIAENFTLQRHLKALEGILNEAIRVGGRR